MLLYGFDSLPGAEYLLRRLAASFNLGNLPRWTLALSTKYLLLEVCCGVMTDHSTMPSSEDSPIDLPTILSLAGAFSIPVLDLLTLFPFHCNPYAL
jgi:hypothetical protein